MSSLRTKILTGLLGLCLSAQAAATGIAVTTLDGKASTFAEHISAGHWTVVVMWTTYCNVCRRQYPVISSFHDAHQGKDAVVLGVSLDGPEELATVQAYVGKKLFSYPTVVADSEVMARMFEAATGDPFTGTPTYMIFNPERKLVAFKSGDIAIDALENYLKATP